MILCSVTIKAFVIFDREIVLYKFSIILCILVIQHFIMLFIFFHFIYTKQEINLYIVNCRIISIHIYTVNI